MKRIKVLRSNVAVEKTMKNINDNRLKNTKKNRMATMSIKAKTYNSIDEKYLEEYSTETASEDPKRSTDHISDVLRNTTYDFLEPTDFSRCKTISDKYLSESNIIPDECITGSNFVDEVRGNVIKTEVMDSFYIRPARVFSSSEGLPHHTSEWKIIGSDAISNLIENPFKGMDLTDGATISMWVKIPDRTSLTSKRGLLLFVNELQEVKHPTHPSGSTIYYQSRLSIDCQGNFKFDDAYGNYMYNYISTNESWSKRGRRVGRNWEHFVITFTKNECIIYINGQKYNFDDKMTEKGKRFDTGERPSILDFISADDVKLFLAVTVENDASFSDSILFDDIMFYASSVDDQKALELYEEALNINLP